MNNRYRNAPGLRGGPVKATPSTLCQKCLKRGHYSFECKVSTQDRPYVSRPSRTQQLQNPELMPKLTNEVPNDLLRKKGVADELLSKQEKERGRKRDLDDDVELLDGRDHSRKRARSLSSDSSSSVSTISTNSSRSESPKPRRRYDTRDSRERSPERTSPSPRGSRPRKRRYSDSSSEYSYSSGSPVGRRHSRSRERERERDRNTRRRHRESSPEERGRRNDSARRGSWRDRSRSQSMDKSRIARDRRSMTPETLRGPGHHASTRRSPYGESRPPRESSYQYPERQRSERGRRDRDGPSVPSPRRERSLSPYSKRLALTQAMSMGR
ncbi:zinc knuckle-domain-containing protein [Thermoascus aurantiacus ATCC 26904]